MKIFDFDRYPQNDKVYAGMSGRKVGITINGVDYLVKYPGNLKNKNMKNINLSYSNSPVSEYFGSHVYNILGIPVHETLLGTRNGKLVVACQDFLEKGEQLMEFGSLKITMEPAIYDSMGNETDGLGTDLEETLQTIRLHPILSSLSDELENRFWDMFIVDALIGNPDRNNGNWGIIKDMNGNKYLAPVYDNGNSLNCKWDDQKMIDVQSNSKIFIGECYNARRCIFENRKKRINPYHFLQKTSEPKCINAIERMVPVIAQKVNEINQLFKDAPDEVLPKDRKRFLIDVINIRINDILVPVYNKIQVQEQEKHKDEVRLADGRYIPFSRYKELSMSGHHLKLWKDKLSVPEINRELER